MAKKLKIRSSTAEFLIFQLENKEQGIETMYADGTIWYTQKAMAALFEVGRSTIAEHLQNAFNTGELTKDSVCRKFRRTAADGKEHNTQYYHLDAVISVSYRVNSIRAIQFRQWATSVLRQYAIRGYVLDRKRMENGTYLGEDYFEHLLAEIREIRLSERLFYQKLTDIYATSMDYNKDATTTRLFFKRIQKEMLERLYRQHSPLHGCMAVEQMELEDMGRIVTAVLEFAESRAKRHIPMTMEDWAKRIDAYLSSDERPLLVDVGSVSHEEAVLHAETEFERYRIVQDRLFQSDFDRYLGALPFEEDDKTE